ncbi:MAG: S-methyl-5'-thioinosine phosphorylase [Gammaproteobacteria bacterium]|nr:S-methyl-5'-thioinosine phosphorylase [Gammaproteobacteria bacterium]
MRKLAIIGGSGFGKLPGFDLESAHQFETPYGSPSGEIKTGHLFGRDIVFLPRHGEGHTIPPHKINYRANVWALKETGVTDVMAFAAVGGITEPCQSGALVLPDQLIDYTWGRESTYYDGSGGNVEHIDFSEPYTEWLRSMVIESSKACGISLVEKGVYGVTQGPRLETPAEINRMEKDGVDVVGMTGMPEASLAREAGLNYVCLAMVVNAAAGRSPVEITMDLILENLKVASDSALELIRHMKDLNE